jgi:hypothetical protein
MLKYIKLQKVLTDNKKSFPNNDCLVDRIDETDKSYALTILDKHCPILGNAHTCPDCKRVFKVNDSGDAYMICTDHKCTGQIFPIDGIRVPIKIIKQIFIANNNNNYGIINNNYGRSKYTCNVKILLNDYPKIFDDDDFNKMMIDTLSGDDTTIASTLAFMYKDKVCFVDHEWYIFNGYIWKLCENVTRKVVTEFTTMYGKIRNHITSSKIILGINKPECMEQISDIVKIISNEKKNMNILAILGENLLKKNVFDLNGNLFAFTNGVYDFERMEFRPIVATDMISKTSGYGYSDKYCNKRRLINMLTKVFPDNEIMECFLVFVALSMCREDKFDLILVIQWARSNALCKDILINLIEATFGEYYFNTDELSPITGNKNKTLIDVKCLKYVRFVISNSITHISNSDISQLVYFKSIKLKTKNTVINEKININFSTLCMCSVQPTYDDDIVEKIGYIKTSVSKYEKVYIDPNDMFLLLVEYLDKFNKNKIRLNMECLKFDPRTDVEKICKDFMDDCIKIDKGRVKCQDMYDKYITWSSEKNGLAIKPLGKKILFLELKKYFLYNKSTKIANTFTSVFNGCILK